MTPTEELYAAAAKLRAFAEGTTPTPWRHHDIGGHTATVVSGEPPWNQSELVAMLPSRSTEPSDHPCWANSRWIAMVHPGLAEPLALVLEDAIKRLDDYVARFGDRALPAVAYEMTVARVINGTVPAVTTGGA